MKLMKKVNLWKKLMIFPRGRKGIFVMCTDAEKMARLSQGRPTVLLQKLQNATAAGRPVNQGIMRENEEKALVQLARHRKGGKLRLIMQLVSRLNIC